MHFEFWKICLSSENIQEKPEAKVERNQGNILSNVFIFPILSLFMIALFSTVITTIIS